MRMPPLLFDGTPVSAPLPSIPGPWLHGPPPAGLLHPRRPAGQERPDFAWFSMPLIQFLTLQGFAVFVPNVRQHRVWRSYTSMSTATGAERIAWTTCMR